jgi:Uncharacterized protein conserved in bacteria (DUF2272)/Penicillin-insensitive murein endopeptidase
VSALTFEPDGVGEALDSPFAPMDTDSWTEPTDEGPTEAAVFAAPTDEANDASAEVDELMEARSEDEEAEADGGSAIWQPLVRVAVAGGLRDRNQLTNLVFFARHPERKGRKLARDEPGYSTLSGEWLRIRDTIVSPVLHRTAGATQPTTSGAGPLAVVATPLPSGATANRFGVPEAVEALAWIQKEWTRRHPDVRFGVRDISRRGGGRLGSHKSHRVGLDADVNLTVNGKRVGVRAPDYERHRPLVQELVEVIRANPVLPIKTIGFLDPKVSGVAQWPGHTKHLHVRFCRPERYASTLDLDQVYAKGEAKPSYDCGAARELEDGHLDLYYEEEDDAAEADAIEEPGAPQPTPEAPVADAIAALALEQLRLRDDEAEGFFEPFRRFAQPFQQAIAVLRALRAGRRDENDLTDMVFFERFPTHKGRRPSPGQPGFTQWSEIRGTLVRPLRWGHIRTEARRLALAEWEWWRRGRRLENEPGPVQDRLTDYWAATPRMPTGDAIWQESWSAAFISWVLQQAGTGADFRYHNAHRVFVHWAVRNAVDGTTRPVTAHPANGPDRVKPRVGDLVCTQRGNQPTTYAELAGLAQPPAGRALHCDLVTDVSADRIFAVGGNKAPAHGVVCPVNPQPDGCTAADAAAGHCGCTVNRVSHRLDVDGFLSNNPRFVAIVRLGP